MLKFDWKEDLSFQSDGGGPKLTYSTRDIGLMIKLHLKWARNPLVRVKFFVQDIFSELKQLRYHDPCSSYPTISIGNLFLFNLFLLFLFNLFIYLLKNVIIASVVHIMNPLLRTLTFLWKETMDMNISDTQSVDDNIDVSILIDITNCFSNLIMLTKNSSDDSSGQNSVGVGFDRRAVLHAALKEGRIFMEQFIKTTKGLHRLFASQQQLVVNMLNTLQVSFFFSYLSIY